MPATLNDFKYAAANYGTTKTEIDITVYNYDGEGGNLHIRNKDIESESMVVTQSICDDDKLLFGGCIANSFEISICKDVDLTGKYILVTCTQNALSPTLPGESCIPVKSDQPAMEKLYPGYCYKSQSFNIFAGEVYSCKLSKNGLTRKLLAYDRFFWKGNLNCYNNYKNAFTNGETTLRHLRLKLLKDFHIRQQDIIDNTPAGGEYDYDDQNGYTSLPADDFTIYFNNADSLQEMTLWDALRMIAEFNGVFMWLNGSGNLEYITADNGSSTLDSGSVYNFFIDADAEISECPQYDAIHPLAVGTYELVASSPEDNVYDLDIPIITHNYAATGAGNIFGDAWDDVKSGIMQNFGFAYRPFELQADARLWLRPGDRIKFDLKLYALNESDPHASPTVTNYEISTVILSRRITGIQAMTDELRASGEY